MNEKVLGLLGLALRGGNLAVGEAPVEEAALLSQDEAQAEEQVVGEEE